MHQQRILSRTEALLRDPASGQSNLAATPGQWHELGPARADERFEVASLGLTLAGPGLLAHLDGFAGAAGRLEFGIDLFDGYGLVRDLAALVPYHLASGPEWQAGTHTGTHAASDAGMLADGSSRLGLKGLPQLFAFAAPAAASWESAEIPLRWGRAVAALSWDTVLLRDASGATVAAPRFELRTGTTGVGGAVTWGAYTIVASTAVEVEAGQATLVVPLGGDVMQIRVTLPYQDPGTATPERETIVRTATLFGLCAWIVQDAGRWHFGSVAELIDRSEIGRHLAGMAWQASDDVAILRLPVTAMLRGSFGEKLRARFVAGPAGVALTNAEVYAVADLRIDPSRV